jgi:hypothetical protein
MKDVLQLSMSENIDLTEAAFVLAIQRLSA